MTEPIDPYKGTPAEAIPGFVWLPWNGPETTQPRSYAEADRMFGVPASHHVTEDADWKRRNIIDCHGVGGKWPTLPGVPAKWYVAIHYRIEPYLREALRRASISAPDYKIERLGGYVWRTLRHRPGAPISPHARGIAVDIDPDRNPGQDLKRGQVPRAFSPEWFARWPGSLPAAFVQAFHSCGFRWGADWNENGDSQDQLWMDLMHMEWVAGDGNRSDV